MKITVSTIVAAPIAEVWRLYSSPDDSRSHRIVRGVGGSMRGGLLLSSRCLKATASNLAQRSRALAPGSSFQRLNGPRGVVRCPEMWSRRDRSTWR
jgi:hypothetical protein